MNWHTILEDIHHTLKAHGFHELSQELFDAQLEGGTGGEIFSIVLDKLIQIKKQRPDIYLLIREEIDWMIAYARKINYL